MPERHRQRIAKEQAGRNNPRKSTVITTGSPRKKETVREDLARLEQDPFVATGGMVADEGHYFVPKKATGYVLWNRLNQVSNPARLDESGE